MKSSFLLPLVCIPLATRAALVRIDASSPAILYQGRVERTDPSKPVLGWSGTSATIRFQGTQCQAILKARSSWWRIEIDGKETSAFPASALSRDSIYTLASGLDEGMHTVTLYKRTEVQYDRAVLSGFLIDGTVAEPPPRPSRRLQFIGNSITCGYGALDSLNSNPFKLETEDHSVTYAALTARSFGAEEHAICWSGKGAYRNNDNSTTQTMPILWELATPGAAGAGSWDHANWVPDAVVIDLGTNDFAQAPEPDGDAFEGAFLTFLKRIRQVHPNVPVILLDGPMLSDYYPIYQDGTPVPALSLIRAHMKSLASRMAASGETGVTTLSLTPQVASVGYGADWHPNRKQHQINAKQLVTRLGTTLGWDTVGANTSIQTHVAARSTGLRRTREGWSWNDPSRDMAWTILDLQGRTIATGRGEHILAASTGASGTRWATRSDRPGVWMLPIR